MCNKTEFIRKAIDINHFNSENFVWIDFGIRHLFKSDNELIHNIQNLDNKLYNKIRIPHIWNLDTNYGINYLTTIMWYFAGGVFGGNKDYLIKFADLNKEKCIQIINESNTICWEAYYGNHDSTILSNY